MKRLLFILVLLLTSCVAPSGDEIVVMTKADYETTVLAGATAGVYGVCMSMAPIQHCRKEIIDTAIESSNTPEDRLKREKFMTAIDPFIQSAIDGTDPDTRLLEEWFIENSTD